MERLDDESLAPGCGELLGERVGVLDAQHRGDRDRGLDTFGDERGDRLQARLVGRAPRLELAAQHLVVGRDRDVDLDAAALGLDTPEQVGVADDVLAAGLDHELDLLGRERLEEAAGQFHLALDRLIRVGDRREVDALPGQPAAPAPKRLQRVGLHRDPPTPVLPIGVGSRERGRVAVGASVGAAGVGVQREVVAADESGGRGQDLAERFVAHLGLAEPGDRDRRRSFAGRGCRHLARPAVQGPLDLRVRGRGLEQQRADGLRVEPAEPAAERWHRDAADTVPGARRPDGLDAGLHELERRLVAPVLLGGHLQDPAAVGPPPGGDGPGAQRPGAQRPPVGAHARRPAPRDLGGQPLAHRADQVHRVAERLGLEDVAVGVRHVRCDLAHAAVPRFRRPCWRHSGVVRLLPNAVTTYMPSVIRAAWRRVEHTASCPGACTAPAFRRTPCKPLSLLDLRRPALCGALSAHSDAGRNLLRTKDLVVRHIKTCG